MSSITEALVALVITGEPEGALEALGEVNAGLDETMDKTEESNSGLLGFGGTFGKAALAVGAIVVAVVAGSDALAAKYQDTTNQLAAQADISVASAQAIGKAFLTTGGQTTFSAQEILTAYTGVAAQLKQVQGSALNTQQAMTVMAAATNLADASGTSLTSTTSDLATLMQTFQIPVKGAASAADTLYNASNASGISIDNLTSSLQRAQSKAGAASPSLQELSAFMLDLRNNNISAKNATGMLGTAINDLIKPANDLATAQASEKSAMSLMTPAVKSLVEQYQNGSLSYTAMTKAAEGYGGEQYNLITQWGSANTAATAAQIATKNLGVATTNAHGQLLPLSTILGEVHDKIAGESKQAAIATLTTMGFGTQATALYQTFKSGSAGFDKATDSVTKSGTAARGAALHAKTLAGMLETGKSAVEDFGVTLGLVFLPPIQQAAMWLGSKLVGALTGLESMLNGSKSKFSSFVSGTFGKIISAGKKFLAAIGPPIKNIAHQLIETLGPAFSAIGSVISVLAQTALPALATVFVMALDAASALADVIGPVLRVAFSILSGVMHVLSQHTTALKNLFVAILAPILAWKTAMMVKSAITSSISKVSSAIKGVKSMVDTARLKFMYFKDGVQNAASKLKSMATTAANTAKSVAQGAAKMVQSAASTAKAWAKQAAQFIANQAKALALWIKNAAIQVATTVAAAARATAVWIAQKVEFLAGLAVQLAGWIATNAVMAATAIATGIAAAAAFLLPLLPIIAIGVAIAVLVALIVTHWNLVKSITKAVWDWVKKAVMTVVDGLVSGFKAATALIGKVVSAVGTVVSDVFHDAFGLVKDDIDDVVDAFKAGWALIQAGATVVGTALSAVFNGVKSAVTTVGNAIGSVFKAAFDIVISAINFVIGGIDAIKVPAVGIGPVHTPAWGGFNIPKIPMLAAGATLNHATMLAIGGEAGTEHVVPDLNMRGLMNMAAAAGAQQAGSLAGPTQVVVNHPASNVDVMAAMESDRRLQQLANRGIHPGTQWPMAASPAGG